MKNTPADNAISTRLGVPQHIYERMLTDVPRAYIKTLNNLDNADPLANLIAFTGNDLLDIYCPVKSDIHPRTPDELEEYAAIAYLLGIMVMQTHFAVIAETKIQK